MSNRRNFIQYEHSSLSLFLDKQKIQNQKKTKIPTKNEQNAIKKEENLREIKEEINLTSDEILNLFDNDLSSVFYKRLPKTNSFPLNISEDKKKENNLKANNIKNIIFKPNLQLDPPKIDEMKKKNNENIHPKYPIPTNTHKKLPISLKNFEVQYSKNKQDGQDDFASKIFEDVIKKKEIADNEQENNEINQLKETSLENTSLTKSKTKNTKENENNEIYAEIAEQMSNFKLEKNNSKEKIMNPIAEPININIIKENIDNPGKCQKKNQNKKAKNQKTNSNKKPPTKKTKKLNVKANAKKQKKKTNEKTAKEKKSTNIKKKSKTEAQTNEDSLEDQIKNLAQKPKKNRKENENFVRLNLKKIYKDRFRGQTYNYKNNYTKNGRPKPKFIHKSNIMSIKSYKIEQMLSTNSGEADPFLSSLSESLKIPILLSKVAHEGVTEQNDYEYTLPNKNPIEYSDEDYKLILKKAFGFEEFRTGQLEAIKSIIQGKSTLVILQTGIGKSLIYAMCALLMQGLTIVISPLVSLMFDQIEKLPKCLKGACINGLLKPENKAKIYNLIKENKLQILYISPETLETSFLLDMTNKISFVCIDEIHCVSEWSHNFRTSYLKLSYLIRDRLKSDLILGLTATATVKTIVSIEKMFDIKTIISNNAINRSNLILTTSRDQDKFPALLEILRTPRYAALKSIIIYCTLIRTTENIANYLSQSSIKAIPYHSECNETTRLKIQKEFMEGSIRIVVSTLAFGMGIDKKDVDGIIHLNMPKSLENYIQEIGRAGRNGKPAYCHLFLSDEDYYRIRGYVLSESFDEVLLKKLIKKVFKRNINGQSKRKSIEENENEDVGLALDKVTYILEKDLCAFLQCNASMIMTILLKMEEFLQNKFEIFPLSKIVCNLKFYKNSIEELSKKYQIFEKIQEIAKLYNGCYQINLVRLGNLKGEGTPLEIMRELQKIAFNEGISFEMNNPAFCYRVKENIDEEIEEQLIKYILNKSNEVEKQMLFKVIKNFL